MPNTTHGLPYPSSSDPVAQGAAAIQALAQALDGKLPVPMVQARASVAQGVNNNAWTNLILGTEDLDTDNQHDPAVKPNRLTCKFPGWYLVFAGAQAGTLNASGSRLIDVRKNENDTAQGGTSTLVTFSLPATADTFAAGSASGLVQLALNEYISMQFYQSSGAVFNIVARMGWLKVA